MKLVQCQSGFSAICSFCIALSTIVLLAGCATRSPGILLPAVGPSPGENIGSGSDGALVVYSAMDVHFQVASNPYFAPHSDYSIFSEDGKLVRRVHNSEGGVFDDPKRVFLAEGQYRIVARANGYGKITVPLVISRNRLTTVHLDGGFHPSPQMAKESANVRLPNGEVVGPSAQ